VPAGVARARHRDLARRCRGSGDSSLSDLRELHWPRHDRPNAKRDVQLKLLPRKRRAKAQGYLFFAPGPRSVGAGDSCGEDETIACKQSSFHYSIIVEP